MRFCVYKETIYVTQELEPLIYKRLDINNDGNVVLWVIIDNDFYESFVENLKNYFRKEIQELWLEGELPEWKIKYGKNEREAIVVGKLYPYGDGTCMLRLDLSKLQRALKEKNEKVEFSIFGIQVKY